MKQIWSKIEAELATKAKPILESMNPPADEAEIEGLEEHIGQELPPDFRDFLLIHNGQEQESNPGFFDMFSLLPLEQIQESWDELEEIRDDVGEDASCPADWLPIAEDGSDMICVELETGAVSKYVADDDQNEDVADSFESWLADMLAALKNNEFAFDPESGFGIEPKSSDADEVGDEDEGGLGDDGGDGVIDSDDDDEDESAATFKFTAKTIEIFEDDEKVGSAALSDIVRVRVSSYAGEPLVSLNLPDGSEPEEIELSTNIANSADLFKFLGRLKGWDEDAFKEALNNADEEGETVVWG